MFSSVARGAGLVGLAVIIGIVLLQVVDDGTNGPVSGGSTAETTTTTAGGEAPPPTTTAAPTTTTAAPRPPAQVRVVVLNGSGVAGAAGAMTTTLRNAGYQMDPAADAQRRVGTVVYFKEGYQAEAAAIIPVLGRPATAEPLPSPAPAGTGTANLVVVLGT